MVRAAMVLATFVPSGGGGGSGGSGGSGGGSATYTPVPGSYSDIEGTGSTTASFTITASAAVIWNYSKTGTGGSCNVTSGTSATSITFTLIASAIADRDVTYTVTVGTDTWTIELFVPASGTA